MPKDMGDDFKTAVAHPVRKRVRGSGGGKSGDGPKIDKDTLSTSHILRVVEAICEGPIKSISAPYFDRTPLIAADGSRNFKGITYATRLGLPAQSALPNMTGQEAEVIVDALVEKATPVVRSITDEDIDDCKVQIKIPSLFHMDKSSGDMTRTDLTYRVQYRPNGGNWIDVTGSPFTLNDQKATSAVFLTHRFSLTGAAPWDIRVVRVTDDSPDPTEYANDLYFYSFTQIINQKFTYPNTALVGFVAHAEQFGTSVPARGYLVEGLICRVPSNFDPITRTYTGVWNGTFKNEWTDCPAWCLRELIRNPRWGLGRYFPAGYLNDATLYAISAYCAQQVPDGKGGTEPRFTFNAYISTRFDAYQLINSMVSVFRGMVYYAFGAIHFTADSPRDPELTVTRANTINGEFTYRAASLLQQHNRVNVTYNDPKALYEREVVSVDEPDDILKYGLRSTDIVAFGCTSEGQAIRAGRWLLYTERMESETVTYVGGEDHVDIGPGSVVRIMDPVQMGVSMGGRLKGYGTLYVDLDRPVTLLPGETYELVVHDKERVLHYRPVSNAAGSDITRINVGTALPSMTLNPVETIWALRRTSGPDTRWRVINNKEVGRHQYEITAVRHQPSKYAIVEQGLEIPDFPEPLLPTGRLPAPLNLRVRETTTGRSGTEDVVSVTATMTRPADPRIRGMILRYAQEGKDWKTVDLGLDNSAEITNLNAGARYQFQAQCYDGLGRVSAWTPMFLLDLDGDPVGYDIPNISGVLIISGWRAITLRWTNPNIPNFQQVEIWGSETNNFGSATLLTATSSQRHQIGGLGNGQTMHLWSRVRVHGPTARYSGVAYLGFGTTTQIQGPDIAPGTIGTGALDQSIIDLINEAGGSAAGDVEAAQAARDAAVLARQQAEAARDIVLGAVDDAQDALDAVEEARDLALNSENTTRAIAMAQPILPFTFEGGKTLWINEPGQHPDTATPAAGEIVTDAAMGKSLEWTFNGSARDRGIYPRGVVPAVAGHIYRVTLRFKIMSTSDGNPYNAQVGLAFISGSYVINAWPSFGSEAFPVAPDTMVERTYIISSAAGPGITYANGNIGSMPFMRIGLRGATTDRTAVIRLGMLKIEDITDVWAAAASATAAAGSADTAVANADAAGQSASAAHVSATEASTSAGSAQTYAGQASTSRADAEGFANAAAISSGAAATSRRDAVRLVGNPYFAQGVIGWGSNPTQTEEAAPVPAAWLQTGGITANAKIRMAGQTFLVWKGLVPVKQGNFYRVRGRVRRTSAASTVVHVGVQCLDSLGANLGNRWAAANSVTLANLNEWTEFTAVISEWGSGNGRFMAGTMFAAPIILANNGTAAGEIEVDELSFEDVSGEMRASGFADAAFSSAGTASTKADEAGVSASAASVSATNAASSYDASIRAVADTLPATFENDGRFWTSTLTGPQKDRAALDGGFTFADVTEGRVAVITSPLAADQIMAHRAYVPVRATRIYRFTITAQHVGTFNGGSQNGLQFSIQGLTTAKAAAAAPDPNRAAMTFTTANQWQTFTFDYVGVAGVPFITGYLTANSAVLNAAGRSIRILSFAVNDVTAQVAAQQSADDAFDYRGDAETFAGNASTSASNAAGSESAAATYSGIAATAQRIVRDTVADSFPPDFQQDSLYWTNSLTGAPGARGDLSPVFTFANIAVVGRVAQLVGPLTSNVQIAPKAYIPVAGGRRYRVTALVRHVGAFAGNNQNAIRIVWRTANESYANAGTARATQKTFVAADTWETISDDITLPASPTYPYLLPYLEFASTRFNGAGTIQVARVLIEDVTAQEAAAASAASAVISAGTATTKASEAGVSAGAASVSATNAQTARSGAETALGHASTAENNARGYSSQAYAYMQSASRLSSGGANPNPIFNEWTNAAAAPDGPLFIQQATGIPAGQTGFAKHTNNPDTPDVKVAKYTNALWLRGWSTQTGEGPNIILRTDNVNTMSPGDSEWVYVKAEIEWIMGGISGMYIQVSWFGDNTVHDTFWIDPLSFYAGPGKPCTLDRLFTRPAGFQPGTSPLMRVRYCVTGGGSNAPLNTIVRVHRFDFEAVHAQSQAVLFQRAKTSLEGIQSAAIGLRAVAGSTTAELELVALENPNGAAYTAARISADKILLDGTVTTRMLAVGDGANLIGDSSNRFGFRGWNNIPNGVVGGQVDLYGRRGGEFSYSAVDKETFQIRQTGASQSGWYDLRWLGKLSDGTYARGCEVRGGGWYEISAALACQNAFGTRLLVSWRDNLNNEISMQVVPGTFISGTSAHPNNGNPDTWPRVGSVMQAPTGAFYAVLFFRHEGTATGQTQSFSFMYAPMIRASAQNAELSRFIHGGQTVVGPDGIETGAIRGRHVATDELIVRFRAQMGEAVVGRLQIGGNELYVPYYWSPPGTISISSTNNYLNPRLLIERNVPDFEGGGYIVAFNCFARGWDAFGTIFLELDNAQMTRQRFGVRADGGSNATYQIPVSTIAQATGFGTTNIKVWCYNSHWNNDTSTSNTFTIENMRLTLSGTRR